VITWAGAPSGAANRRDLPTGAACPVDRQRPAEQAAAHPPDHPRSSQIREAGCSQLTASLPDLREVSGIRSRLMAGNVHRCPSPRGQPDDHQTPGDRPTPEIGVGDTPGAAGCTDHASDRDHPRAAVHTGRPSGSRSLGRPPGTAPPGASSGRPQREDAHIAQGPERRPHRPRRPSPLPPTPPAGPGPCPRRAGAAGRPRAAWGAPAGQRLTAFL
jgi:hypothetical protein